MNKLRQWLESHQKLLELLVDLFAAWLLAAGVMMTVCAHLEGTALQEITSRKVLWFTLLAVLCTVLFSRKWWLLPATAVLSAGGIWLFSRTEHFELFFEKLSVYIDWCITGCLLPDEELAPITEQIVHNPVWVWLVMALLCGALTFLLMRRLFSYLLLFLLSAGGIGLMTYGVHQETIEPESLWFVIAVLLMCLIATLPRVYARYLKKHGLTNSSDKAEGGQMTISRISLQLFAVPAALLCVGASFMLIPKDTSEWKSTALNHFVSDMGDLLRFSFGDSAGYWEFNLSTTNLYPLGNRLGGPVELSDDRILTVKTDTPVLLKGSVHDTYTGSNWIDSKDNGHFRLESLMWVGKREDVLNPKPASHKLLREQYPRMLQETELSIYPEFYWYSTVFAPERVDDVQFWSKSEQEFYFNEQGEVYTEDMLRGPYTVKGYAFLPRTEGVEREMELLERFAVEVTDKEYGDVAAQYLQLPDSLPNSIRRQTAKLIREEMTPYQKACAIADWLGANSIYSLTPAEPPADRDFVEWFIETKEGYCTYYASAMAVMARCAGIPSRYVSGFGLRETEKEDWYYVSESTGHAWAELYFAGIGWVPFDSLGWSTENEALRREPVHNVIIQEDFEEEEELYEELLPEEEEEIVEVPRELNPYFWIGVAVAAFIGLIWLLIAVITYPKRHWSEKAARKRSWDAPQWTEAYYGDILRQLSLMELRPQPGETLFDFAHRVDRRVPVDKGNNPMDQVAQWVCAWRFGEEAPPEESLHKLCDYHLRLEQRLRILLGAWEYFWKRCVSSFFIRK